MRVIPDPIGPGQESVWSYPRPAVAEPSQRRLKILHRDVIVAETQKGIRTLETSHPPTFTFHRLISHRWSYSRRGVAHSVSGKAKRSTSTSSCAMKRCAM